MTKRDPLSSGIAGASSMAFQVVTLMPFRTVMNYQYKNGGSNLEIFKKLYHENGIKRFYRGITPALIHAPLSRFGDVSCNIAVISYLDSIQETKRLPLFAKTFISSSTSIMFRVLIIPIDALKSTLQTTGSIKILNDRIKIHGVKTLWNGSYASLLASFVGTYTWFSTFNHLETNNKSSRSRNIFNGAASSLVSGICSNGFRVVKTYRQTHHENISYLKSVSEIGLKGLVFRGLGIRLAIGCVQGGLFTLVWKEIEEII